MKHFWLFWLVFKFLKYLVLPYCQKKVAATNPMTTEVINLGFSKRTDFTHEDRSQSRETQPPVENGSVFPKINGKVTYMLIYRDCLPWCLTGLFLCKWRLHICTVSLVQRALSWMVKIAHPDWSSQSCSDRLVDANKDIAAQHQQDEAGLSPLVEIQFHELL